MASSTSRGPPHSSSSPTPFPTSLITSSSSISLSSRSPSSSHKTPSSSSSSHEFKSPLPKIPANSPIPLPPTAHDLLAHFRQLNDNNNPNSNTTSTSPSPLPSSSPSSPSPSPVPLLTPSQLYAIAVTASQTPYKPFQTLTDPNFIHLLISFSKSSQASQAGFLDDNQWDDEDDDGTGRFGRANHGGNNNENKIHSPNKRRRSIRNNYLNSSSSDNKFSSSSLSSSSSSSSSSNDYESLIEMDKRTQRRLIKWGLSQRNPNLSMGMTMNSLQTFASSSSSSPLTKTPTSSSSNRTRSASTNTSSSPRLPSSSPRQSSRLLQSNPRQRAGPTRSPLLSTLSPSPSNMSRGNIYPIAPLPKPNFQSPPSANNRTTNGNNMENMRGNVSSFSPTLHSYPHSQSFLPLTIHIPSSLTTSSTSSSSPPSSSSPLQSSSSSFSSPPSRPITPRRTPNRRKSKDDENTMRDSDDNAQYEHSNSNLMKESSTSPSPSPSPKSSPKPSPRQSPRASPKSSPKAPSSSPIPSPSVSFSFPISSSSSARSPRSSPRSSPRASPRNISINTMSTDSFQSPLSTSRKRGRSHPSPSISLPSDVIEIFSLPMSSLSSSSSSVLQMFQNVSQTHSPMMSPLPPPANSHGNIHNHHSLAAMSLLNSSTPSSPSPITSDASSNLPHLSPYRSPTMQLRSLSSPRPASRPSTPSQISATSGRVTPLAMSISSSRSPSPPPFYGGDGGPPQSPRRSPRLTGVTFTKL